MKSPILMIFFRNFIRLTMQGCLGGKITTKSLDLENQFKGHLP
jgi:hypothetical protein